MEPNREELNSLFDYDSTSGDLIWKKKINNRAPVGSVAGSLCGNYPAIRIFGRRYYKHRLVWVYHYGSLDSRKEIDHINRNKLDSRIENLRVVTHKQNHSNRGATRTNSSGHVGVIWYKKTNRWRADITRAGRHYCLGYFKDFKDAARARVLAENSLSPI